MGSPAQDAFNLAGRTMGGVVVLERVGSDKKNRRPSWKCRCHCGTEFVTHSGILLRPGSHSCGCWKFSHRQTGTAMYKIWLSMRRRCDDPNGPNWDRYGGRGIAVCERWSSFDLFLADVGQRPSKRHTLERKDNDGDYCPENCVWKTRAELAKNRCDNVIVEAFGKRMILKDWSKETGVNYQTLRARFRNDDLRAAFPIELLLSAPGRHFNKWKLRKNDVERAAG